MADVENVEYEIMKALELAGYTHIKSFEGGVGNIHVFEKEGVKTAVEVSEIKDE
jgi:hypothetical protein